MAPKPKRVPFAAAAASGEGTLPDTQVVQRSTRIPGSPKAADQECDGDNEIYSSDEIGETAVPPPNNKKGKAVVAAAQVATPLSLEKAATSSSSEAARSVTPEVVGSADDVAPLLEAASPPGVEEDLSQPQEEYDEDNHFKEKSQRYPYLWQLLQNLEEKESLTLKEDFLRMDDATANSLNTEYQEVCAQQLRDLAWEKKNEKDVTEVLMNLMERME